MPLTFLTELKVSQKSRFMWVTFCHTIISSQKYLNAILLTCVTEGCDQVTAKILKEEFWLEKNLKLLWHLALLEIISYLSWQVKYLILNCSLLSFTLSSSEVPSFFFFETISVTNDLLF